MSYTPAADRYDSSSNSMGFRRVGRSGLKLPEISLGLWHNVGHEGTVENQRAMLRRAFDRGVTHFDLANNYGVPAGSAEANFGEIYAQDFRCCLPRWRWVNRSRIGWTTCCQAYALRSR